MLLSPTESGPDIASAPPVLFSSSVPSLTVVVPVYVFAFAPSNWSAPNPVFEIPAAPTPLPSTLAEPQRRRVPRHAVADGDRRPAAVDRDDAGSLVQQQRPLLDAGRVAHRVRERPAQFELPAAELDQVGAAGHDAADVERRTGR